MQFLYALTLAVAALFFGPSAHAGYAQLKPPPGWSQGLSAAVPGQVGTFAFGPAANYSSFKGSTVLTNAALNVAGQYVTVPVSMRLAANAATVAAEYSFGNPYLFAAALAVPIAYSWFQSQDVEVKNGVWIKRTWKPCTTACVEYTINSNPERYASSPMGAAQLYASTVSDSSTSGDTTTTTKLAAISCSSTNLTCTFKQTQTTTSPSGSSTSTNEPTVGYSQRTKTKGDEILTPLTKPQFHEIMDPLPLPQGFPKEVPSAPLPYEIPVLNPNPANIPETYPTPATPAKRPLWVPTGDPAPASPATSPQTWTQPGQNHPITHKSAIVKLPGITGTLNEDGNLLHA